MFSILLAVYLRTELLGQMATLSVTFWGTAKLFSKEFAPFKIPTSDTGGFHLPQFDVSGYEVVSHCSFNLRFSNDS